MILLTLCRALFMTVLTLKWRLLLSWICLNRDPVFLIRQRIHWNLLSPFKYWDGWVVVDWFKGFNKYATRKQFGIHHSISHFRMSSFTFSLLKFARCVGEEIFLNVSCVLRLLVIVCKGISYNLFQLPACRASHSALYGWPFESFRCFSCSAPPPLSALRKRRKFHSGCGRCRSMGV